ncbi:MAG: DUF3303 family protein [Bacteroidetes bacterium]|nr:DUF3303 family protein [Bacteroidota bacterium]
MIVEHFHREKIKELYGRFAAKGRMLPAGLTYINSWIDETVSTCYQLMETEDLSALKEWINKWNDLADFEIVPVISSAEAKEKVMTNTI